MFFGTPCISSQIDRAIFSVFETFFEGEKIAKSRDFTVTKPNYNLITIHYSALCSDKIRPIDKKMKRKKESKKEKRGEKSYFMSYYYVLRIIFSSN